MDIEELPEKLPTNSESYLVDDTFSRFSSAEWAKRIKQQSVTIVGLGGIGSHLAYLISRLNVYWVYLYDQDIVEKVNLSGQMYGMSNLTNTKVSASAKLMQHYSNFYNYTCQDLNYSLDSQCSNTVMCGVDNMEARKVTFNRWLNYIKGLPEEEREKCLFLDGRLAAEEFQVFCIKGDENHYINKYKEEWLFTDEEAEPTICSYKQTSFCATMIASIMTNLFVNFITNQGNPVIPRALPFFTYYDVKEMFLKNSLL